MLPERDDVEEHGLVRVVQVEGLGVGVEQFRGVVRHQPARLDDDEVHRFGPAVKLQPEEGQMIGDVEQLGPGVFLEPDESLRQVEVVGPGGRRGGVGLDFRQDFHERGGLASRWRSAMTRSASTFRGEGTSAASSAAW